MARVPLRGRGEPVNVWCPHLEQTEPDEKGFALCLECGACLIVSLTEELFDLYVAKLRRRARAIFDEG